MVNKENLNIRNVVIIAHVDHGKTTLVDALLKQSGTFRLNESVPERVMDSLELEKERGITIAAKNCCLEWEGLTINIVDTPGHADFGGEVERTLSMVDGALLLVDAAEGPLPQTRFVVKKALEAKLPMVLIINKIDRKDAQAKIVEQEVLSLLLDCGADVSYLNSPVIYADSKSGKATLDMEQVPVDMRPVFEAIRDYIPEPKIEKDKPLSMIIANIGYSDYVGRLAIGRMKSGKIEVGDLVLIAGKAENHQARVTHIYGYQGLKMIEFPRARAGQIVVLAGIEAITIGDTVTSVEDPLIQTRIEVEEPTVKMLFSINTSAFAGRDGKYITSNMIGKRLEREGRQNVSIRIEEGSSPEEFMVSGRGELQLSIIIETMRREGYELQVGRPSVIEKKINGVNCEPFESLTVDIPEQYIGVIRELMASGKGIMTNMTGFNTGRVKMDFHIPSRGLIGIRSTFLSLTHGNGIMYSIFKGYEPWAGDIPSRINGALVADRGGRATSYAIVNLEPRGRLFVSPGEKVYAGMIVGEHSREKDLEVNITKQKNLTNMRSSTSDQTIVLASPLIHTLESAMEWIKENEVIEVTPKSLRLRRLYSNFSPKTKNGVRE